MLVPLLALALAQAIHPARQITLFGNSADALVMNCRDAVRIDEEESGDANRRAACLQYIAGVFDGQSYSAGMKGGKYPVCLDSEVTLTQMAKVIVKYGDEHPEKLHQTAIYLINAALESAYPCHGK
jgi:hypothetical protein